MQIIFQCQILCADLKQICYNLVPRLRDQIFQIFFLLDEFEKNIGQRIYTSATPGKYEYAKLEETKIPMIEQIIRPTGLIDPEIDMRPVTQKGEYPGQVKDFIAEAEKIADEYGVQFSFSLEYGMGGTYYPTSTNDDRDWDESNEGWVSSSNSC